MILSYEQAELKHDYLKKEIAKFPSGHEVMIHDKYPGIYIASWPEHPELKGKRVVLSKPEGRQCKALIEKRKALEEDLAVVEGYLQFHSFGRKMKEGLWMDRGYFDACVECGNSNPRPKPEYAPEFGDIKFRSKSEMNIAQLLTEMGYEFVYETEFEIMDDVIEYPDFTVWVPEIGRCFILEHFGRMDKREYKSDTLWKIEHYVDFGLLPGRDIVFTFESDRIPLDLEVVRQQINALIIANTTAK